MCRTPLPDCPSSVHIEGNMCAQNLTFVCCIRVLCCVGYCGHIRVLRSVATCGAYLLADEWRMLDVSLLTFAAFADGNIRILTAGLTDWTDVMMKHRAWIRLDYLVPFVFFFYRRRFVLRFAMYLWSELWFSGIGFLEIVSLDCSILSNARVIGLGSQ